MCSWVDAQDPENLGARDLSSYDYVKSDKRVDGESPPPLLNWDEGAMLIESAALCLFVTAFALSHRLVQTKTGRTIRYEGSTSMLPVGLARSCVWSPRRSVLSQAMFN